MPGASPGITLCVQNSRRYFVTGKFGLVEVHLLDEGARNARPRLQALIVTFDRRPRLKLDAGRCRPVEHGIEISVADAEPIEQEFAAGEVFVEVAQARFVALECVRP